MPGRQAGFRRTVLGSQIRYVQRGVEGDKSQTLERLEPMEDFLDASFEMRPNRRREVSREYVVLEKATS